MRKIVETINLIECEIKATGFYRYVLFAPVISFWGLMP